jgi:hypothetical protein
VRASGTFIAHQCNHFGRRANEDQPGCLAGTGKIGILCQKANTRMNRIHSRPARSLQDSVYTEVGLAGWRGANVDGRVRFLHMQCVSIRVRINGYRPNP